VLFKPRGWSWVDPVKEVDAFVTAVQAGFTTVTDVIAQTAGGLDIEDVIATRTRELEMFEEADINVSTTVPDEPEPMPASSAGGGGEGKPAAAPKAPKAKVPPDEGASPDGEEEDDETDPPSRVVSFGGKR
jgi:capsid protein